jgi:hypothetical protein
MASMIAGPPVLDLQAGAPVVVALGAGRPSPPAGTPCRPPPGRARWFPAVKASCGAGAFIEGFGAWKGPLKDAPGRYSTPDAATPDLPAAGRLGLLPLPCPRSPRATSPRGRKEVVRRLAGRGRLRGPAGGRPGSYSIVMPPPNVTGVLTMGHVLNNTLQDILIRRARLEGKSPSGSLGSTTPASPPRPWWSASCARRRRRGTTLAGTSSSSGSGNGATRRAASILEQLTAPRRLLRLGPHPVHDGPGLLAGGPLHLHRRSSSAGTSTAASGW